MYKMRTVKGKFLAIVCGGRSKDKNSVMIKADPRHSACLNGLKEIFAYYIDSLMTTVREFKNIKCCEFFKIGDLILDPKKHSRFKKKRN
jgi:hypothetical protein